jgi:hypothetical protein
MRKMNSILAMALSMIEMSNIGSQPHNDKSKYIPPTPEEIDQKRRNQKKRLKDKGVKEFFYGRNSILARDQKNADRKAKNKGWIN